LTPQSTPRSGFDEPDSQLKYLLTPGDTLDKIDEHQLKKVAQLAGAITYAACASDKPVARHRKRI
jgi:hypothetical protein